MFYELSKHKLAYLILGIILLLHVILFFFTWPNKPSMRILSFSLALSYFSWGVLAHVKSNHITKQIVKEYFFASVFAGLILFLLTL